MCRKNDSFMNWCSTLLYDVEGTGYAQEPNLDTPLPYSVLKFGLILLKIFWILILSYFAQKVRIFSIRTQFFKFAYFKFA